MGILQKLLNSILGNTKPAPSRLPQKKKVFATMEESQNNKIDTWKNEQDICDGLEFVATMQLRTPLRVLLRHGEIHSDINSEPPKIANEMWEGIWIIKTKTWNELGLDLNEVQESTMASEIGQIRAGDYLPFLIAVREIVELNDSIDSRINKLREKAKGDDWRPFIRKHGGINKVIAKFFPRFIDTIPKINEATIEDLSSLSLDTPNIIAGATDEALLTVKGIGQAKLKVIRDYCAGVTSDRDAKRLESVTR
ncbi:MAG: hypothetical protein Q7U78_10835 [Gallionella sp.]|nr:hypothetical protein [Gallionella sp.]